MNKQSLFKLATPLLAIAVISGCSDDDDDEEIVIEPLMRSYEVQVVNLTPNQPLSPVAALVHDSTIQAWMLGSPAIVPLEVMAEGGDNSQLLAIEGLWASASGAGVIMPGASETMMLEFEDSVDLNLTLATMLVNTNDAFTGLNSWSIDQLAVGDSWSATTNVYDAGTEANSETAATIPGPAAGGEGYAEARDDVDRVYVHAGVISADDGLTDSALSFSHRFDNPAMKITITRIE
ncbi:spondin domain-containing protein [Corallincola platygyrae]|uniref:Spondin domain-containing protein n=1 Tax=Corallincola platygyrae TaxID=1193278 RepID=A0ABW4XP13_9GAMM